MTFKGTSGNFYMKISNALKDNQGRTNVDFAKRAKDNKIINLLSKVDGPKAP